MDSHKEGISTLSRGAAGVKAAVPSGGGGGGAVQGSPTVAKLRQLMEAVETIKAERQVIESELKDTKVDMKPVFFDAMAKNSVVPEHELSVESLGRCYGPLQKQVADNMARQEATMAEVQQNHEKFVAEAGGGKVRRKIACVVLAIPAELGTCTTPLFSTCCGTCFRHLNITQLLVSCYLPRHLYHTFVQHLLWYLLSPFEYNSIACFLLPA